MATAGTVVDAPDSGSRRIRGTQGLESAEDRGRRPRLAVALNILAPYRAPLIRALSRHFEVLVLHSGMEPNRSWDPSRMSLGSARVCRVPGWSFRVPRRRGGEVICEQYLHVRPGIISRLACFRPDVVISNEMGPRTWMAGVYSTIARVPFFVWWGGTPHTEAEVGRLRRIARQLTAATPARFISYGKTSTAYLHELGIDDGRITQIQNSVDERSFLPDGPAETFGLPRTRLLYVGQLVRRKGVHLLLDAVARQQTRGMTVSLALVGDGPERAALEHQARSQGLSYVRFCGAADSDLIQRAYRGADALVLPTLEDVWGLVANEAICCGTPVACSTLAGCAEELVPDAARFDPRDPAGFDRVLELAAEGNLPVERERVWPTRRVADVLIGALDRALGSAAAT